VKDLFDNVVLCALEGKNSSSPTNSESATATSAASSTGGSDPRQSIDVGAKDKGKQKAGSDDENESEKMTEPLEDRATRPGLSMEEQGNPHFWDIWEWVPIN
jgi:hypothetical protein